MVLAFAIPLTIGSAVKRLYYHRHPPPEFHTTLAIVIGIAFVATIGYGFWSTWKNLRCPKCETNVWYLVSRNASTVLSSSDAPHQHCPRCDAHIVGPILQERTKKLLLTTFLGGILFSVAGVILRAIFGK
jgi:hypothetical protein